MPCRVCDVPALRRASAKQAVDSCKPEFMKSVYKAYARSRGALRRKIYTSSRQNIEHLIGHMRFELVWHDVTVLLNVEVDEFYNLACTASAIHCQRNPVQTANTSVYGV